MALTTTLAANATHSILTNIATSDFVTDHGCVAAYALRTYQLDIANDIFKTFAWRDPTEAERTEMAEHLVTLFQNRVASEIEA